MGIISVVFSVVSVAVKSAISSIWGSIFGTKEEQLQRELAETHKQKIEIQADLAGEQIRQEQEQAQAELDKQWDNASNEDKWKILDEA